MGPIGRTVGRVWSWFKCRVPSDLGRVWYHLPTERLTTPRCARGGAGRSFDGREQKIMFGSPTNSISWLSPLIVVVSWLSWWHGERVKEWRLPGHGRRLRGVWSGPRSGVHSGGGRRTGTRARSGSRSAPTCAEHGRLQRILRSLGLGRVWFCVVFSKLNTSNRYALEPNAFALPFFQGSKLLTF